MKKIFSIIIVAITLVSMTACSVSGPILVTDNTNEKVGKASFKVIFGFPPKNADASIAAAAKNGDITRVSSVDYQVKKGFIKTTYTTIVTGN